MSWYRQVDNDNNNDIIDVKIMRNSNNDNE